MEIPGNEAGTSVSTKSKKQRYREMSSTEIMIVIIWVAMLILFCII